MNVEDAKKICPEFSPEKGADGKWKCRFKIGEEMCKHDKHFLCDLVLHIRGVKKEEPPAEPVAIAKAPSSAVGPAILASSSAPIISASRVNLLEKCPRLYYLNYVLRVQPPYEAAWKRVGTAFTECRAAIDEHKLWSLDKYKLTDVERVKLEVVLKSYEKHVFNPKEKLVTETKVSFEFGGRAFVGYIDAETESGEVLYEWKYAATEYDNLRIARQAAVYYYGKPQAKNFIVAIAKKPQHKPKKAPKPTKKNPDPQDESMDEFLVRLTQEADESGKDWFKMRSISRSEISPEIVLGQMVQSMGLLPEIEKAAFPPHYSGECENCEFQHLCEEHLSRDIGCTKDMCKTRSTCTQIISARKLLNRR